MELCQGGGGDFLSCVDTLSHVLFKTNNKKKSFSRKGPHIYTLVLCCIKPLDTFEPAFLWSPFKD